MEPFAFQAKCWELVAYLEPWIWWVKSGSAAACFGLMFFQPWRVPWHMKMFRYASMGGMIMIALSAGNTALGPLGDILFWPTYMAFQLSYVIRLVPGIRAQMREQPPFPEKTIFDYTFRGKEAVRASMVAK